MNKRFHNHIQAALFVLVLTLISLQAVAADEADSDDSSEEIKIVHTLLA